LRQEAEGRGQEEGKRQETEENKRNKKGNYYWDLIGFYKAYLAL
jgi:hypothetical protein